MLQNVLILNTVTTKITLAIVGKRKAIATYRVVNTRKNREDTMTNKEKREILNELDGVLMELLDVVDKVQTVDESRLITEEGEVQ